jgi:hypothetical protein
MRPSPGHDPHRRQRDNRLSGRGAILLLVCGGLAACHNSLLRFGDAGSQQPGVVPENPPPCAAGAGWLPHTPSVTMEQPASHPAPECPFYRDGFQSFLIATEPDPTTGEAALTSYATVDDVFDKSVPLAAGALAPAGAHRGTALRAWLGQVKQAGGHQIVIDQDGHPLYYGIHVNQAFADFVTASGLRTRQGVQDADSNLRLPPGVVTLQSTWKDVDPADGVAGDYADYITTRAWVARLRQDPTTGAITEDVNAPREIKVALVALHVAYALPGHPELIWTTFEHTGASGQSDLAPAAAYGPAPQDPLNRNAPQPASADSFLIYQGGTPMNASNLPFTEPEMRLDQVAQSFPQRTSIYRMYPGSRSHTDSIDPEIVTLNQSVRALFQHSAASLSASDKRGHYRLVGGLWLDKPEAFALNSALQNDSSNPFVGIGTDGGISGAGSVPLNTLIADIQLNGTDSQWSILGGQDRLTGVATESFVQPPGSFNNCLTCHNTQSTTINGIPSDRDSSPVPIKLLDAKRIGVSHVFSAFLADELSVGPSP